MCTLPRILFRAICPALLALCCSSANAIILSWDGDALDGNWNSSLNWDLDTMPIAGDTLIFQGTTNTNTFNNLANGTLIEGINFTNTGNGQNFSLSGNSITLNSSITTTAVTDPVTELIEDVISLDIALNTTGIGLNTGLGHNLQLTGIISGAQQLEVNNGINAQDDGVVTLSAANIYTGGTLLNGGRLIILDSSALGTGELTIEDLSNTNPVIELGAGGLNITNAITLSDQGGNKSIVLDLAGINSSELSGTLTLDESSLRNNRTLIGEDDTLTISGIVSGVGGLSLRRGSAGSLILTGANTNTGDTILEAGTLVLANNSALGTGNLLVEDRGVNPILELTDGLALSNNIEIRNRGGNKTIRLNQAGSTSATLGGTLTVLENGANNFDLSVGDDDQLTINGAIDGAGSARLNKLDNGTLILTGTSTHNGGLRVQGGVLLVNGDHSAATGDILVDAGGELGGTGQSGGSLLVDGTIAPGENGIEYLQANNASFDNGSVFDFEFDSSAAAAVGADVLILDGNLSLTGTVNLQVNDIATSASALALNTTLSLIYYDGAYTGDGFTFGGTGLLEGDTFTAGLNTFRINYTNTDLGDNFAAEQGSGQAITLTAVPEPSTYSMLTGLFALSWILGRRKRR